MNDSEIIKALKHCNGGDCEECKALKECHANWVFLKEAYKLINRQKTEIEKLREENDSLKNGYFQKRYEESEHQELIGLRRAWENTGKERDYFQLEAMNLEESIKTAKAEIIKEFAEIVKAEDFDRCIDITYDGSGEVKRAEIRRVLFNKQIDNLVKEMGCNDG